MDQSHLVPGKSRWIHGNQVQESPIWEPEPPDPGEFQVGPQSQSPGDGQVATGITMCS